jgi:eukaryotic-like serine/threonine-protein kinase
VESEDRRAAEELLSRTLDLTPEEREALLEDACRDRPELRRQVEELAESHARAFAYFDELAGRVAGSADLELDAALEGTRIGAYRILQPIGRGGMATVFLAERADGQFEQRVALKLIRRGMETRRIVRRFLAERQILARLQHPHIARLLDGGVTEDGRPYFVMEHVAGRPLTEYCDEKRLTVEQRLRLFGTVGRAVQYAHGRLIVHRDLKPSNVLVTADGTVKLLDFGIAKVLAENEAPGDTETWAGGRPMTPRYAAPEQFRGDSITTATDVYALGVVLYELLTGRRPYRLRSQTSGEVERAVLTEDAEAPSAAVRPGGSRGADATPESRAAARGTTPARLARRLTGELDTICLTALRKDPERRYRSPEQLVDDVRRHLEGLPITAHKDTLGYRVSKFVGRHRLALAVTTAVALLIVGFAVAMAVQSARVARERDKAERVAALFVDLFQVADPGQARGTTVTARELLERGAAQIEAGLRDEPEVQASLLLVLGRVHQQLGLYDRAASLVRRSLEARQALRGPEHPDVAESLKSLGDLMRLTGDYAQAESLLREALRQERRFYGPQDPRVGDDFNLMGKLLLAKGAFQEAETFLRQGVEVHRREARRGGDEAPMARSLSDLAAALSQRGQYDEAERLLREALALHRKLFGQTHPRVATTLNNLGLVLYAKGDLPAAEPILREALDLRRRLLEPRHPEIAQTANNLALLLQDLRRFDEAEALHREALEVRRQALGPDHPLVAGSLNNLGLLLQERGAYDEAARFFQQALESLRRRVGPAHPLVAISLNNLGGLALDRGRLEEAARLYRESLDIRRKALRPGHPDLAWSLLGLGRVALAHGDAPSAEPLLREALAIRSTALPSGSWEIAEARAHLGLCLATLGRREEAEAELLPAYEVLRARRGAEDRRTVAAARGLAELYRAWGRSEEAERFAAPAPSSTPKTRR